MVPVSDRRSSRPLAAILRRLLEALATAWAAASFTFFSLRLAAGDPLASLLSRGLANAEQVQALRQALGLDRPLLVQYLDFLRGLLGGDLGRSLYTGRPVARIIAEQFPPTAQLALAALGIALLLGFAWGILAAWRAPSWESSAAEHVAGLATSLPVAFTGILAIILLGRLVQGGIGLRLTQWQGGLAPAALVLGFATAGAIAKVVQGGLEETRRAPFMLGARARGIPPGARLLWHALRPSLPPAISLVGLEAAFLLAGTVVTETIFARPGLGRLLVSSILQGDYPVAQGIVVFAALLYTLSNSLADVLAFTLDPRLREAA
jgi:peptide/nickel transport system permease protein